MPNLSLDIYMKTTVLSIFVVFMLITKGVFAYDYDKRASIKTLVEQGVVMALINGKEILIKEINNTKGIFVNDDLYLFVGSLERVTILAHPYNKSLIQADLSLYNDESGNYSAFELAKTALEDGAGWVQYWYKKPGSSNERFLKFSYVMKVPTQNYYVGGGYYK